VLIGVNDLIRLARRNESENGSYDMPCVLTCGPDVGARYDALLGWMRAHMPATRIVVSALTPTAYYTVARANAALGAAAARYGAAFVECPGAVDPRDRRDLPDGIHLSAAAHARLIACLRPVVFGALARALPPGDAGPVPGPAALEAARPPPPRVAAAAGGSPPPPRVAAAAGGSPPPKREAAAKRSPPAPKREAASKKRPPPAPRAAYKWVAPKPSPAPKPYVWRGPVKAASKGDRDAKGGPAKEPYVYRGPVSGSSSSSSSKGKESAPYVYRGP
jgi:hypothetical protein